MEVKNMTAINKRDDVLKKIMELYPLLSKEDCKIAIDLHKLAIEWDLKIGINIRSNAAKTKTHHDIQYSIKKPVVRMVFLFKICVIEGEANPTFQVKLKLLNIDKYRPIVEACPDNIKNLITFGKECDICNTSCTKQMVFTLDGMPYNMCTFGGGIFENLSSDEWALMQNLIIEEYKAHATV